MEKINKLLKPALFALAFLLIFSYFNPQEETGKTDDVILETDTKIAIGKVVQLTVRNNRAENLVLPASCPENPLKVEKYINGEWSVKEVMADEKNCSKDPITIKPEETFILNFGPWNHALFGEEGRYRLSLETSLDGKDKIYSQEIEVGKRSIFQILWQEAFYKPIFNVLIFFIDIVPGHNLGWAVVLLTLAIKILLLVPNQKALKAQKQMQKIQPQLEAIKKKYKDNQQKLAEETMKIWQKHKVNPMSSCMPMLIQFPVLIALFYVVKDGLNTLNPHLLYAGLQGFDPSLINSNFLNLIDLTQINYIALPIIIGGLQFFQMKMSMGANLKKQANEPEGGLNPMPMMNRMMLYFMPLMIAVFTATLPAAVGLYWGTSTLFGIGQQFVVNRAKD